MSSENTTTNTSCYLVAGGFLFADRALTATGLDDVINSLLLAQLSADKQSSRITAFETWGPTFQSVLSNIGWLLTEQDTADFTTSPALPGHHPASFSPLDAITTELGKVLPVQQAKAVRAAVAGLTKATGLACKQWQEKTLSVKNACSVICFATQESGTPWLALNYNALTAPTAIVGYPWTSYPAIELSFQQMQARASVNEAVFGPARHAITEKVAAFRVSNVVPLSDPACL